MLTHISQQNYFELFQQPVEYKLNLTQLQENLRVLQKQFHPDNFAAQAQEQLNQALAASSLINQAYTTLLQPLSRAIYLLQLHGIKLDLVHDTKFAPSFLFEQIEWREQISAAELEQDFDELEAIEQQLQMQSQRLELQIEQLFLAKDYTEIGELVKQLAFYSKLEQLVSNILAQM